MTAGSPPRPAILTQHGSVRQLPTLYRRGRVLPPPALAAAICYVWFGWLRGLSGPADGQQKKVSPIVGSPRRRSFPRTRRFGTRPVIPMSREQLGSALSLCSQQAAAGNCRRHGGYINIVDVWAWAELRYRRLEAPLLYMATVPDCVILARAATRQSYTRRDLAGLEQGLTAEDGTYDSGFWSWSRAVGVRSVHVAATILTGRKEKGRAGSRRGI